MAKAKFLEGDLMRHVSVMAFTGSIGLTALFLVDFVDMIFVSILGETALAAVGYAGATIFFTVSVGIGLSIATAALCARSIGAGDPERARRYASTVCAVSLVVSTLIAATVWLLTPNILSVLGATGESFEMATSYMRIIVPSMPVLVLAMCGSAVLRAHGDAGRAMWTTLSGGIVNAILDPIVIFWMGWGLEGAAIASVCARFATFGAAFWPVFRYYGGIPMPTLTAVLDDLRAISNVAVPAVLTNIATPVGSAYVTMAMAQFGDQAVAGASIINRIAPVAFGMVFSLSGAVGPIIGQNFGARQYDRVERTLIDGLRFALIYILVVSLLLFLMRDLLAGLFAAQGTTLTLIYLFCGPVALTFFFNGALFVANASFNNLNRPLYSTALNWGRNTIGTVPFVIVGADIMGAGGVLVGQAAGGIVFGIAAVILAFRLINAYKNGDIDPDAPKSKMRWLTPLYAARRR